MSLGAFSVAPTNPAGAPMGHAGHALNGYANGADRPPGGGRGGRGPLPHISDITSVWPADVSQQTPMRTLLDRGHGHLRLADTFKDIGKQPDKALKEYLLGSIIAIQMIPRHRDFHSLAGSQTGRLYDALKLKISSQHSTYEDIKASIIRDNESTGVQPTNRGKVVSQSKPAAAAAAAAAAASASSASATQPNGSPARSKPIVHPKPSSLHGNTIQRGENMHVAKSGAFDLSARFAKLEGPKSRHEQIPQDDRQPSQQLQQQDPRIRTQPIVPAGPQGPRSMPSDNWPKLHLNSHLPDLPKMPDAIYSPARGTVSTEAGQLPSSTPRGLFSRTGSTTSFSGATNSFPGSGSGNMLSGVSVSSQPPPTQIQQAQPHQNRFQSSIGDEPSRPQSPAKLSVPQGDSLTAEQLFDMLKAGPQGRILLIDVRPRDQFDDGHIMCRSIICIEPSVLLRENISAEEIAQSNVLAPAEETTLFDRRDTFDLVVFYDQSSESVPKTPVSQRSEAHETRRVLLSLQRALLFFNYQKELRHPPKLLRGGLDAWVDLLGSHSLRTSSSSSSSKTKSTLPSRPYEMPRGRRRSEYVIKPLKPDEVKAWQETLKREDIESETAQSPDFVRSTEDFLRRFPPVSVEQESMTSPVSERLPRLSSPPTEVPSPYSDLPSPPTRPAPALPRPSYSGLSQRHYNDDVQESRVPVRAAVGAVQPTGDHNVCKMVGLVNPRYWCYANSSLQALRASPGFGTELSRLKLRNNWQVPNDPRTGAPNPQLMLRIMGNLFTWMATGHFAALKAQTLMQYSLDVCKRTPLEVEFGGDAQQDAHEFIGFLFTALEGETNRKAGQNQKTNADGWRAANHSQLEAVYECWRDYHSPANESIIDQYFKGMHMYSTTCSKCNNTSYRAEAFNSLILDINQDSINSIDGALRHHIKSERVEVRCGLCNNEYGDRSTRLGRLPELLMVTIRRFDMMQSKITKRITFDPDHLNLEPYFIEPNERKRRSSGEDLPREAYPQSFDYECYAVVVHAGKSIQGGHYYAYVRNNNAQEKHRWYLCNDENISEAELGSGRAQYDSLEWLFCTKGDAVPYILFYRAKRDGMHSHGAQL